MSNGLILPRSMECRPSPSRRRWSPTQGFGAVLEPDGSVVWQEDEWQSNALIDEGEAAMLNDFLKESVSAANVGFGSKYLCLINGGTTPPVETSTMAYLGGAAGANETQVPAANGYNRQQVVAGTDWTDDGLIGGDARFSAAQKTFGAATAAWTITHVGMVTAATGQIAGSGKFLLFLAISASTAVASGQSFLYTLRFTQS